MDASQTAPGNASTASGDHSPAGSANRADQKGWRAAGLLAVVALLAWLANRGLPDGRLHVYFLDVGQGDATFVRTPTGQQILVDGGPSPAALLNELSDVLPFWDRTLDLVVLTHPDQDHMAGLLPVFERYQVATVLDSAEAWQLSDPTLWREHLAQAGVTARPGCRGMQLSMGSTQMSMLHPGCDPSSRALPGDNNHGLVLRLAYGRTSFLLAGDAEREAEADMLAANLPLRVDVLKVGHHGSDRSTTPAFLTAVAPRLAVIQVGEQNRFGHPHPSVLERLASIPVLRTDHAGRIEVISDGQRLWVQTARPVDHAAAVDESSTGTPAETTAQPASSSPGR